MPTYTFRNKETQEVVEHVCKMSELDAFKEANPHLERFFVDVTPTADPVRMGRIKPPGGFNDLLKHIHKNTAGSVIKGNIR
jgi:hypothetical protein